MIKITIIGAGSSVFTKNIVTDILLMKEFKNIEFSLMDIDEKRLKTSYKIVYQISKKLGVSVNIKSTTNRKSALQNSNFVLTCFQVGGYEPSTLIDFNIPKKYGLNQTIADTIGIGGIMRGLRTIPVLNSIAQDILEYCPNAILLQYVNPMCINMIALYKKFPELKTIGLCHSVQGTISMIAKDLKEDIKNISFKCAGINHMAFYTQLEKKLSDGQTKNLYPDLKKLSKSILSDQKVSSRTLKKDTESNKYLHEKVRYEILNKFGYFVTESSEHFAEYVPWFIKKNNKKLIDQYRIPLNEYIDRCKNNIIKWENYNKNSKEIINSKIKKSKEYAADIIKAILTDVDFELNGNVYNEDLIENLPNDCVVEVPCTINKKGIKPHKMGKIPIQLAALMQTNINVQLLTVEAALTKNKEYIYQAALLDPHTASELSIKDICNLVDELLVAHSDYLPKYN